jgi:Pectate lyase superfamily protein
MVALSSLAGAGWQFFGSNGLPLAGGKLYTYSAGTTTPLAAYTSSSGATPHANPIILDSAGRVPSEVWLTSALVYKFTLKTAANVEIWTKDNIPGIITAADLAAYVTYTNLASTAVGKGSALAGFIQTGTGAVARTAQDKMRESLSVLDFGANPTGTTDSTTAIQAALDAAAATPTSIKSVFIPSGVYKVGRLVLPRGSYVYGEGGKSETTEVANTRLVQNADDDVFIFDAFNNGSLWYWFGQLSDFTIIGNNAYTNGYGLHAIDTRGNNVLFQDQTLFENLSIRAMPKGGMNFTSGALPMTIRCCKFLWNGGPGITMTRIAVYNGVHLDDISADGNVGGAIKLVNWNVTDNVLITNLKSEMRVNSTYGGGAAQQQNPIVVNNCNNSAITIVGANHISSVPDGAYFVKPGSLVLLSGANYPQITWNGVLIRVRATDTGTDPYVIEGFSSIYTPPYTVQNGTFGTDFPFYNSRMLLYRSTSTTSATPSVANLNALTMNYASATTITNFTDGVDGQILLLLFTTANATIQNNSDIALATGKNWTPINGSTLTLAYLGAKWREISRGYSANLGNYTITNVTTDRAYDASATTTTELANVLGTLISDLTTRGVI